MIVRLLSKAKADLRSIGDYIERDDSRRAVSFLSELMVTINGLATMAESFPLARLPSHPDVRRRLHGRYGIFFSVDIAAQRVDVHRVIHLSRDILNVFSS